MAFGKNKKNRSDNNAVSQTPTPVAKKRNETLASVLNESVLEAAIETFASNKNFITTFEGEKAFIGLLFDVADIGGLSKKTNKNEDKGTFVEQIKSGRIKTLVTEELLHDEKFIIIPDPETVYALDEFSMLQDVNFTLCYVRPKGDIIITSKTTTLEEIAVITQRNVNAASVLFEGSSELNSYVGLDETNAGDEAEDNDRDYTEVKNQPTYNMADEVSAIDDIYSNAVDENEIADDDDGFDEDDVAEYDESLPDEGYQTEANNEPYYDDTDDNQFDDNNEAPVEFDEFDDIPEGDDFIDIGEPDESFDDDEEEYTGEVIDEESVKSTIARKFYSDDLGLEITTEPFDVQFQEFDTFVPFAEDREEGWINGYLNQMSKDANAELAKLHRTNIFRARDAYFTLISRYAEDVQRKLDIQDADTKYGKLNNGLKAQRIAAKKNIDKLVADKKRSIEQDWEETLNQVGNNAANMARQQYSERFGDMHRADLFRVEQDIVQSIENDYHDAIRIMNDDRRAEAHKLFDYGINSTLKEVSKIYQGFLDEEQARYKELQDDMTAFIDSNRKDEVARINALKEEQERADKAAQAMQEASARVKSIEDAYRAKEDAQKDAIKNMETKHDARLAQMENDCNARISEERRLREASEKRVESLTKQIDEVNVTKDKEYASRINELKNEKDAWKDKCKDIENTTRRSSVITYVLLGVAVVASLAVGILFGITFGNSQNNTQQQTQTPVVPYYYQQPYAYQAPNVPMTSAPAQNSSNEAYVETPDGTISSSSNSTVQDEKESESNSEAKQKKTEKTKKAKETKKSSSK